jgi:hypothetical protein
MASEMRAADWVDEVNQADSLDELDDILNRYADSGADYKSVEDAVEKKRATLSGEIPEEEPDEDAADEEEEDDGRAKLQMGDPSAGQTPDPEAVEAAEAEAAEKAEEIGQLPAGEGESEYEEKTLLLPGTWVVLADTPRVPIEVVGHEACVTFAPVKTSDGDEQIPFRHQYQDEDITFTVQTRDAYNATVTGLTREDFAEISYNGRAGLGSSG